MPTHKTKMSDPNGSSQQNVLGTNSEKSKADCTAISLHFLPIFRQVQARSKFFQVAAARSV